jgi:hypothetical protein
LLVNAFFQEKKNVANLLMAYKLAANNTTNNPLTSPQRQAMQHKTNKQSHKKQTSKATKTNKQGQGRTM